MTIEDIMKTGFNFELEDKKCSFSMITYAHATKAQNAMYLLSINEVEKGNDMLNDLALNFLIVDGQKVKTKETLGLTFKNPLAIVEINAQFLKYVNVFLNSLPSFQKAKAEKQQG